MSNPWEQPDPVLARVRFTVTRDDVVAAYRKHLRWRYSRPEGLVLPLVCAVAAAMAAAAIAPGADAWTIGIPAAVVFVGTAAMRLLVYACVPLLARRAFRQQKNLSQPWEVELTADGLRARTPSQDTFISWANYVAWSEDDRVVLIYQSDLLFQFMPKAAADAASSAVFHRLVAGLPRR